MSWPSPIEPASSASRSASDRVASDLRRPTRAEVIAILRTCRAMNWTSDAETPPDDSTTVHDFVLDSFDCMTLHQLGPWLNTLFATEFDRDELRHLLRPARIRTLGDVAEEIARRGWVPKAEPWDIAGRRCLAAGWFVLLRERHRRAAGRKAVRLAPSTELATALHREEILATLLLAAPHRFGRGRIEPLVSRPPMTTVEILARLVWLASWLLTPAWAMLSLLVGVLRLRFAGPRETFDPRRWYALDGIPLTQFGTLGDLCRQLAVRA